MYYDAIYHFSSERQSRPMSLNGGSNQKPSNCRPFEHGSDNLDGLFLVLETGIKFDQHVFDIRLPGNWIEYPTDFTCRASLGEKTTEKENTFPAE